MKFHLLLCIAILFTFPGCAGIPELEAVDFDDLELVLPTGWTSKDLSEHQTKIVVFTPEDNTRRESIALVRTHDLPTAARQDFARLRKYLADAQTNMPGGKFAAVHSVRTKHGLAGVRVDGEFVPDGTRSTYRRMHAVLVDGTSLIHILYTARDANATTFDLVLDSLTKKAG